MIHLHSSSVSVCRTNVIFDSRLNLDFAFERSVDKVQRSSLGHLSTTDGPFYSSVLYVYIRTCKEYSVHQVLDLAYFPLVLLPRKCRSSLLAKVYSFRETLNKQMHICLSIRICVHMSLQIQSH